MKKLFVFGLLIVLSLPFFLVGCGDSDVGDAKITRDDMRVGGSLSFEYDADERIIYIGGEGEVIQYSTNDLERGLEEGNRVGIKVTAPNESLDVSTATLEMNGVNYSSGDFLESVSGQKLRLFNIYPLFSKDDMENSFSITWQEGTCKQEYKIVIVEGTKFLDKEGNVK